MTFNFRIVKRKSREYDYYDLIEVYYNEDGSIWGYTDPVNLGGYEDLQELLADLDKFRAACEDELLTESDLPQENTESEWLDDSGS